MKHFLTARVAANGIFIILSLIVLFHVLIITGVIPFASVWGGRLKNHHQMLTFETVSIGLNLLMLAVVAVASGRLRVRVSRQLITGTLWLMTALFFLNTLGNVFAKTDLERLLFTPLTLLLALCCCRLALQREPPAATAPGASA
ncbi:hypothetical protein LJ737_14495 [Hymenobacter sp. 15J16-1T3B]|uniref:hypothetical protein n=1 Tax=Hymenobacter sp. 15J16-1T3B TaxID=2886941 RepID=UPI001D0F65DD|nr:hypothetical protein [Hymenobacter sp. 15J16-1T3B]MCC3158456.1 hypothetical protein [Hymenobacter sp. 15J16-1T3B]